MTIQPCTTLARTASCQATPAKKPAETLQDLYDQRQQELQADEQRLQAQQLKAAKAQQYALGGMVTLFAGMGATATSALAKPLLSAGLQSGLLGTGIGLTAVGLAVFCPALWVRDTNQMNADFTRIDVDVLKEAQQQLADELKQQKEQPKPAA